MPNSIVAEYQAQPWIMEPMALKAFAERIAAVPENSSLFGIQVAEKPTELKVTGGIARIPIIGYLLQEVPDWMRVWGIQATSYNQIAAQVKEAADRKDVKSIELQVNSPGGMVAGVIKAADAIYNARSIKPVYATINSLCASGAYWLTSQAQDIAAFDANTQVGSIGVYTWFVDWTKADEKAGRKVLVVRSGEHKGMGLDEITDNQIVTVQSCIDAIAYNFIEAVARGRGADTKKISGLATGQLWIAAAARELGLIDMVVNAVVDNVNKTKTSANTNEVKENTMSSSINNSDQFKNGTTEAINNERARYKELQVEFADDPEFGLQACVDGLTVQQAKAKYVDVLRERLDQRDISHASGSAAIATGDTDEGTGGDFMAEARELAETKSITVTAAMRKLSRTKPALHQAFLGQCRTRGKAMYQEY